MVVVDSAVEHSDSFSAVDARNVDETDVVRSDTDLWCVEKATAEEQEALKRSAEASMLLENFMVLMEMLL